MCSKEQSRGDLPESKQRSGVDNSLRRSLTLDFRSALLLSHVAQITHSMQNGKKKQNYGNFTSPLLLLQQKPASSLSPASVGINNINYSSAVEYASSTSFPRRIQHDFCIANPSRIQHACWIGNPTAAPPPPAESSMISA